MHARGTFGRELFIDELDGGIDDVRIFSRALTASEIQQLAAK